MIKNSIIFYYKNDVVLGDYFFNSANFAITLLNQVDVKQSHVIDNNCNFAYIDTIEFVKHSEKSLLLIYAHGNEDGFYKNNDSVAFIDSSINHSFLKGGLIYTNACSTGDIFGKKIAEKNASFYGYTKPVIKDPRYERTYIECDNWGLYHIVKGETLIKAKERAKEKFTLEIDRCSNLFTASNLREARDCLVVYGDISNSFILNAQSD